MSEPAGGAGIGPRSGLRIHVAATSDTADIARVHVAAWRETYADILPSEVVAAQTVETRAALWNRILADPSASNDTVVLVAESFGEIVGFGACGRQRTAHLARMGYDAEISAIYVLRASQRRGVGTRLMRDMASALSPYSAASLWVLRDNRAACRFYESLGAIGIGEKQESRSGTVLTEIAYGWSDLGSLAANP